MSQTRYDNESFIATTRHQLTTREKEKAPTAPPPPHNYNNFEKDTTRVKARERDTFKNPNFFSPFLSI